MTEVSRYEILFHDWNGFRLRLRERFTQKLPGKKAQFRLAPFHRSVENESEILTDNVKESSVLILLFPEDNSVKTAVILRNEYNGAHSGQISLPGGQKEKSDRSAYQTALRESNEEAGINPEYIELCGELTSLYIPRSNFRVFPFVGTTDMKPEFSIDPREVKELIVFDLMEIINQEAVKYKTFRYGEKLTFDAPGFYVGGHFMWGATAMIFGEFIEMIHEIAGQR